MSTTVPASGQGEHGSRTTEFSVNADARFQRSRGFEESPLTLQPGALGSAQLDNSLRAGYQPVWSTQVLQLVVGRLYMDNLLTGITAVLCQHLEPAN